MRGEEIVYCGADAKSFWDLKRVNIEYYPDGMPLIKHIPDIKNIKVLFRPRNIQGFTAGIFWMQALRERGFDIEKLVIPFVPGSRMDRLINKEGSDSLFTAKSVANMINDLYIDEVVVLDPHSDVTPALIDHCTAIHVDSFISDVINFYTFHYDAIIAPDAGAEKRARLVADLIKVPVVTCSKVRDPGTGKVGYSGINGCLSGNKFLVVDDICDGGATFLELRRLFNMDAIMDLYVTHGLFTRGTTELLHNYRNIFCTDSYIKERLGVHVKLICENILLG